MSWGSLMGVVKSTYLTLHDTFHKPGFKMHTRILPFSIISEDAIAAPLWDAEALGFWR